MVLKNMFIDKWIGNLEPRGKRGLVFSAGGASDLVLARAIADRVVLAGAAEVDIAQPLNREKIETEYLQQFGLLPLPGVDTTQVLVHDAIIPNSRAAPEKRGGGIHISSAMDWIHGRRLVFAAKGQGSGLVACRSWSPLEGYDFALAVDGGGDILTKGAVEFDRIVLDGFCSAWDKTKPICLVVIGLGADGGSNTADVDQASLPGWCLRESMVVDTQFANLIEDVLASVNRLYPDPLNWNGHPEGWGHGLHVPQIVALAARQVLPVSKNKGKPYVLVPRESSRAGVIKEPRGNGSSWLVLNGELLREARCYQTHRPD